MTISKELAEQFMARFKGLDRAYGRYDIQGTKADSVKKTGRASTVQAPLTLDLWVKHLSGEQGLGVVPITDDSNCVWGCIDVDVYDIDINKVEKDTAKLPIIVCRSKSGGVHAFLFTSEPVPAALMKKKLTEACARLGFGNLEIFPKQTEILTSRNDTGNWLNMPYFDADKTMRYCVKNGDALTAEEFLTYAAEKALTLEELEKFQVFDLKAGAAAIPDGPPCLQILCELKVGSGGRNKALFNFGVYFKNAHPDDWQQRLEDLNRRFFDPPLDHKEMAVTVKSLERKSYNYTCTQDPIKQYCDKPTCVKRKFGVRGSEASDPDLPMIGGLVKFESAPPVWFLDVEGRRIGPLETADIQIQERFQRACIEHANLMPKTVKINKWQTKISELLLTCQVVELPEDSSPVGMLLQHLEHFCIGRAQCEDWDDLAGSNKPYTDPESNITYFKLKDFLDYLDRCRFKEMKRPQITVALKQHGCSTGGHKVKGKFINLWSVPAFEKQDVKLKTPNFSGGDF